MNATYRVTRSIRRSKPISNPGVLLVLGAATLLAADVWNAKDFTQWTPEDANRVLTDSPWAKSASVSFDRSDMGERGMGRGGGSGHAGGGFPGGGMGHGTGGAGGFPVGYPGGGGGGPIGEGMPGGGPGGPEGGSPPSMNVVVRWESALPVRQAMQRLGGQTQSATERTADASVEPAVDKYVVTLGGLPMRGRRNRGENEGGVEGGPGGENPRQGQRDPAQMRERLLSTTKLIPKGRDPIAPDDVKMEEQEGTRVLRFYFPKTYAISMDDKEVSFETRMGPMKVEKKFRLKDMTYKGKLAL